MKDAARWDLGDQRERRLATRDDLPRIVEIYNESIPGRLATADTEPITVADREAWWERHTPEAHPLFVLTEAGRVVAWQSFERFYGRPAYRATAEVSLYVASSHHRQGCGSFLLSQAIAAAPALGLETLLAFIFGHNQPSLALFQRQGFSSWGHLPGIAQLDEQRRDLVILGLPLPRA